MYQAFRLIPASKTAFGRRQQASRAQLRQIAVAAAWLVAGSALQAAPSGGLVVSGNVSLKPGPQQLTVLQNSQNAVINWQSFGIAANETVTFVQPNASAVALNRVLGNEASAIYGKLNANGQVFLINPNGILFGKSAEVNVGGLVASTLNIADKALDAKQRVFKGDSQAAVINEGQIRADGGYIALLGRQVSNKGSLQAQLGTITLAAGQQSTLDFAGDKLIRVTVDQGALQALADNQELIQADGGTVILSAKAADRLVTAVVNNSGVIRAQTLQNRGGVISLLGDMQAGQVNVGGTLDASAPEAGNGGAVETSAARVKVAADAHVTTAAARGSFGNWLIDPKDYTVAASGGDITGAALSTSLASSNVSLLSSAGTGNGAGNLNINDAVTWSANTRLTLTASNDVNVNASITAKGADAGLSIQANTANGADVASGNGSFKLGKGASINLPNVSASSTTALIIGNTSYTVINSLGTAGDGSTLSLQGINGGLAGNYALGSDINAAATSNWNGGAGFAPIGDAVNPFSGNFNGLGHSISGMTLKRPSTNRVGLFGYVESSGTLSNVSLVGGSISGGSFVGALAGFNAGTVKQVSASGVVTGSAGSISVGGLFGEHQGSLSNASASGSVNGTNALGGLVGTNSNGGSIGSAYSNAAVVGGASGSAVGGLVGQNIGSASSVSYVYATGNVSGNGNVGGLVGVNSGSVSGSYASGIVSGSSGVGGLVGRNTKSIASSYWNSANATGIGNSIAGSSLTTSAGLSATQMRQASNFSGFSFTNVPGAAGWVIVNADGSLNSETGASIGGSSPMLASEYANSIGNAHQLQLMAMAPAARYDLRLSIDASKTGPGGKDVWDAKGFVPVGTASTPFTGSLDGANQTISGLTINAASRSNVGLIGYLDGASVRNIGLFGGSVIGLDNVGGLVGYASGGGIANVYSANTVSGGTSGDSIGGLVGLNTLNNSISNSYASGNVSGSGRVGGLVGSNTGATIQQSYASGTVSGSAAGGLVGSAFAGAISDSFWNSDVIADGVGLGSDAGAHGLSTVQLRSQANFSSATTANGNANPGWDFGNTWIQYEGKSAPLLRSFMTPLTVTANSASKTYDTKVFAGASVSYSDTPDARLLGSLGFTGTATTAKQVGSYTLTPTGLYSTQQGYALNFVSAGLNITPATLVVSGSSAVNKVYDGKTAAAITGGSLGGVFAGDTVTLAQAGRFADRNAGNGIAVTATNSIAGASAGNYVLVQPTGLTANITPKDVAIAGTVVAVNKTYDGNTTAQLSGGNLNGVLSGDTVSLERAGQFDSKNVGSGLAVTSTSTLAGASAGNYKLVQPTGLSASIAAKVLTVSASTVAADKVYDGNTAAAVSGGSLSGAIDGDQLAFKQTGNFADKNADKNKLVKFNNILSGTDAGNYVLSAAGGSVKANISQRTLDVAASATANKVYDGNKDANLSGNLVGILAGEEVALHGLFLDKNVGTAKTVKYKNQLSGNGAANYSLSANAGSTTANITPATLTINGMMAASKVYDGKSTATLSGGGLSGVIGADKVKLTQKGEFANKNAGLSIKVTSTSTISGGDAGNYVFTQPSNLVANISPKALNISGTKVASRDYDGSTNATISGGKLAGVIAGDKVTLVQAGSFADKNAAKDKVVIYSNVLTGADSQNYVPTKVFGTEKATIRPKLLSIDNGEVVFADKVYDGTTLATLQTGSTLAGVIAGDKLALLQLGAFTSPKPNDAAVVNFTNTLVGLDKDNYTIKTKTGHTTAVISAP
ncbi:YDG domain-containing protein [Paucibacter sp. TC2R-5]|uniref:YDG domain-containing protein n=1 Tax=Paucibacter sp. TC2R-5 TaxID=2893555 RepID=UPI0021E4FCB5|nr:YDG domain-containing protein [Paucibacter sp. TC2R-5]MCV2359152.1 YDG domain-containing protein [Paucibacter sp. TC2R-5]